MASVCISKCVNGTCLPLRRTFPNLFKWPESDAEFVKMVNSNNGGGGPNVFPRGVECLSSRQIYLRSYKFSRKKEGVTKKATMCLRRLKESVVCAINNLNLKAKFKINPGRAKNVTFATSLLIFHRLLVLSCSVKVDVVHHDESN